jgi:hypothetical protein
MAIANTVGSGMASAFDALIEGSEETLALACATLRLA